MHASALSAKLDTLNRSDQPFALFCYNRHLTRQPAILLCTDLVNEQALTTEAQFRQVLPALGPARDKSILVTALNYEAGYHLEKKLVACSDEQAPLGWLGWFKSSQHYSLQQFKGWVNLQVRRHHRWPDYWLGPSKAQINKNQYTHALNLIKAKIACGESYQVNFTFPLLAPWAGNALSFFAALYHYQPVGYAAMIRYRHRLILSLSPELFISKKGREVVTRPMKGTAPRNADSAQNKVNKQALKLSKKNQAENLMIVDLLRNDLGRICQSGSISVKQLFTLESYKTVYQMTSTVSGRLRRGITWPVILQAIFPCGSVTGAPKIKTMEIIHDLESVARGLYTGACGFIKANGDGQFNVPIRTLEIDTARQQLRCGIGSGVVSDSRADSEWRECHTKSKFLTRFSSTLKLIETLKWSPQQGFLLWHQHLQRLQRSAQYFHWSLDRSAVEQALYLALKRCSGRQAQRVRLLLAADGQVEITVTPLAPASSQPRPVVKLAQHRVDASNIFLYHKTTNRQLYHDYTERARRQNLSDYIFTNEQGLVTEGAISNIFIVKKNKWLTPPVSDGCLPGVMRQHIIRQKQAVEMSLSIDDLKTADQLFLTNGVRGLVAVGLVG